MSLYDWLCTYLFAGLDPVVYEPYIVLTLAVLGILLVGLLIRAFTGVLTILFK